MIENLQHIVTAFRLDNTVKQVLYDNLPDLAAAPTRLAAFRPALEDSHLRALLESITGAGIHHITHTNEELVVLWNNRVSQTSKVSGEQTSNENHEQNFGSLNVSYQLSTENTRVWQAHDRFQIERGAAPPFKCVNPARALKDVKWRVTLNYGDILSVSHQND
jgi:hypothetical protein